MIPKISVFLSIEIEKFVKYRFSIYGGPPGKIELNIITLILGRLIMEDEYAQILQKYYILKPFPNQILVKAFRKTLQDWFLFLLYPSFNKRKHIYYNIGGGNIEQYLYNKSKIWRDGSVRVYQLIKASMCKGIII
jgi:hypothetical protein